MRFFLPLLTALAISAARSILPAAEPLLKPHDVIALVGGEDMVAASESGYLELLLTRALPGYQLRFRDLAREGDTVFEQPRDLNYPTLEQQLDKIGATVVIAQFGQMESLAGKDKLPEFIAAYEKLIGRMSGEGKRRVLLVGPTDYDFGQQPQEAALRGRSSTLHDYLLEIFRLGSGRLKEARFVQTDLPDVEPARSLLRDGMHLSPRGSIDQALRVADYLGHFPPRSELVVSRGNITFAPPLEQVRQIIVAKNRLWSNYTRPQNWAFLNGDRTSQPSSRDHLDPSKRWFPGEIEGFVPLIEAKEQEIDALAAKLAKP